MARLYSNENFLLPAVMELRRLGHDVLTVAEAGHAEQAIPDEQVLAFAAHQSRAVLTINRKHFILLHKSNQNHSGIIVCTLDLDFQGQAERIHQEIESEGDLSGKLVRINRPLK